MSKLIEHVKRYKCLYSVHADTTEEEINESWRQVSRANKQSVARCKQRWQNQLLKYAKYLEKKDPKDNNTIQMEAMSFVQSNLQKLLKSVEQPSGENPVSSIATSVLEDNGEPTVNTIKIEPMQETPTTPQDRQEVPATSMQRRVRRNAIDDEGLRRQYGSQRETETPTTFQRFFSNPEPHLDIPMPTACDDRQPSSNPPESVAQPHDGWSTYWNVPREPNLAFGLFVATTLNKLTARKQIFARENIFEVLKNAELENCSR